MSFGVRYGPKQRWRVSDVYCYHFVTLQLMSRWVFRLKKWLSGSVRKKTCLQQVRSGLMSANEQGNRLWRADRILPTQRLDIEVTASPPVFSLFSTAHAGGDTWHRWISSSFISGWFRHYMDIRIIDRSTFIPPSQRVDSGWITDPRNMQRSTNE